MPVQLGGGIRDLKAIEDWLNRGIRRVILGTIALRDPELVREACRRFPAMAVGIDARDGFVAVEGWAKTSTVKALDLALRFEDAGGRHHLHRHQPRRRHGRRQRRSDGRSGLRADDAGDRIRRVQHADLEALKAQEHTGIEGVICGRALYDGRIDPAEAWRCSPLPHRKRRKCSRCA